VRLRTATLLLALLTPGPLAAQTLAFPAEARRTGERVERDSTFLPAAPWQEEGAQGVAAEGEVQQTAWSVGDGSLGTLELLAPLRTQLLNEGFEPLFECETDVCGGFDFRYALEVLPEPAMHVNLGDFRYFLARRGTEAGEEHVALLISRSASTGFVQLTRVGPATGGAAFTASTKTPAPDAPLLPAAAGPIGEQLEAMGHATLGDLSFPTGSSELGPETFASLAALAGYLKAYPDRRVMLVGHTDAEGALQANIQLSRRRAASVRERLIELYQVPPGQVEADGVGYLAPRASNLSPEGRMQNRRVEVILTSTQ
jgi:OOP family OmpA-OmpF porin